MQMLVFFLFNQIAFFPSNSHPVLSMASASFLNNSPAASCFYVSLLMHYLVMPPESSLAKAL